MVFRWNDWNIEHIALHGVSPPEAELVIQSACQPFPRKIHEDKWLVWGRGNGGRLLQVIFVFDEPLLRSLKLSGKRLVFLTERLAELAQERDLTMALSQPDRVLQSTLVATTFAPVPGWHRRAANVDIGVLHPWPWLRHPTSGTVASYSAWRA